MVGAKGKLSSANNHMTIRKKMQMAARTFSCPYPADSTNACSKNGLLNSGHIKIRDVLIGIGYSRRERGGCA